MSNTCPACRVILAAGQRGRLSPIAEGNAMLLGMAVAIRGDFQLCEVHGLALTTIAGMLAEGQVLGERG